MYLVKNKIIMASTRDGSLVGAPYYTYTEKQDKPIKAEMSAFKSKYGYDLSAPTTQQQLHDIAEVFTRKAGDKLKGETLDKCVSKLRYPHVQDEVSAILWGSAGSYKP